MASASHIEIKCEPDLHTLVKTETDIFEENQQMKTVNEIKVEYEIESKCDIPLKSYSVEQQCKVKTEEQCGVNVKMEPIDDDDEGSPQSNNTDMDIKCETIPEYDINCDVTIEPEQGDGAVEKPDTSKRKEANNMNIPPPKNSSGGVTNGKSKRENRCKSSEKRRETERKDSLKCEYCDKTFGRLPNLKAHLRTHTGEKPYECGFCKKRFSDRRNLRTHARRHTGERPFHCEVCESMFSRKDHLQQHMRSHSGEKPHECFVCHSRFREKSSLNRHVKVVHYR